MWFRNRNTMILSLRNVEIFLVLFFSPLENELSARVKFRLSSHQAFQRLRQLAVFLERGTSLEITYFFSLNKQKC